MVATVTEAVDMAADSFTSRVKFHPKQAAAFWAMWCRPQATVLAGGSGFGGKSYLLRAAAVGFHIWAVCHGYVAPITLFTSSSYEALRDRHFSYFVREWGHLGELKSDHAEYGRCFLFNAPSMGAICFRNISDQSERRGAEYLAGFNDETTEITSKLWGEFLYRVRAPGLSVNPVLAATNPDGIGHSWCKALWRPHLVRDKWLNFLLSGESGDPEGIPGFVKAQADATLDPLDYIYVPFLPDDNPIFDEKTFYRGVGHLPIEIQRARRNGSWESPEGARFSTLDEGRHIFKVKEAFPQGIPSTWPRIMGTDYGLRAPYCNLWGAVSPDLDIYVYREDYMARLTADIQAKRIQNLTGVNEKLTSWKVDPAMFSANPGHIPTPNNERTPSVIDLYKLVIKQDPRFPSPMPGKYKSRAHALSRLDQYLNLDNELPNMYFEDSLMFTWEELTGAVFKTGTVLAELSEDIDPRCADHAITALYYMMADDPMPADTPKSSEIDPRLGGEGRDAYWARLEAEQFERDHGMTAETLVVTL